MSFINLVVVGSFCCSFFFCFSFFFLLPHSIGQYAWLVVCFFIFFYLFINYYVGQPSPIYLRYEEMFVKFVSSTI